MNLKRNEFLMDAADDPAPAGGGKGPQAPVPASSGSDIDWESESAPEEFGEEAAEPVVPAAKAEPKPAAAPATPAPIPAAAPVAAPAVPPVAATPPAEPVQPAAGTPAVPAAPVEPTPPATPAAPDLTALRAQEVARLTTAYALSEDQTRGLMVEPEKHLPGMLAQMHVNIADSVIQAVLNNLPGMVTNLTQQTTAAQRSQEEFYGTWPALREAAAKSRDVERLVVSAITAYRQLNPKATKEEVIRAAGLQAMITLRLPLPAELFAQPANPSPVPPGFQHAAPGAGGTPPVPQPQNPFQLLNREFDEEEQG